MSNWIQQAVDSMGYWGIALMMFAENIVPPIPSEVVMPAAGYAAKLGQQKLWLVILAGSAGSLLGVLPWYWVGLWIGTDRFARWADRRGKWLGISGKDVRRADDLFDRYSTWAVFLGRMIPGVRTLISIPAGVAEMPFWTFVAASALGTALWAGLLAVLGYWLGAAHQAVAGWVKWIGIAVVVTLCIAAVVWVVKRRSSVKAEANSPA